MKHIACFALVVVLVFSLVPCVGNATETGEKVVYYLDDGSYIIETIIEMQSRASGTKTGSKVKDYYDSNGDLKWRATLSGTFTYTGLSSNCTSSSINVTIYDNSCYLVSKNATKSGSTATGTATVGEKLLGITVSKIPVTIILSCDANGNLS